jgi:hypothetical protein
MLEPVRQFAERQLTDTETVRALHGRYYADLAEVAYEALWTDGEAEWIERLEADFANQQVAFRYWAEQGGLTEALTIAITLNQLGELALQRPAGAEVLFAAVGLGGVDTHELGPIAIAHAAVARARRLHAGAAGEARRAMMLARTPRATWEASSWANASGVFVGDANLIREAVTRCVEAARDFDFPHPRTHATAMGNKALLETWFGDPSRAPELLADVPTTAASSLLQACLISAHMIEAERTGNPRRALDLALDTVGVAERAGNRWAAGHAISFGARAATQVLGPDELLRLLSEFLPAWRQANDLIRIRWSLLYCAFGFAHLGHGDFAAKLLGGSRLMTARDQQMHDQLVDKLSEQLGIQRFQELRDEGNTTSTRDLAEHVLRQIDRHT